MWPIEPASAAKELLHHKVEITTTEKLKKIGWVYTIDPISHTVVLYETDNVEKPKLTLVFGHFVRNITKLQDPTDEITKIFNELFRNGDEVSYSEEELQARQGRVKNWLEQNRLPVKVDGNKLKIAEALDILPPYTKQSCQSRNQIILSRVRAIIDAMPES